MALLVCLIPMQGGLAQTDPPALPIPSAAVVDTHHANPQAILPGFPPAHFASLWQRRQIALTEGDRDQAGQVLERILHDKAQSGWPDMFSYGAALINEAQRLPSSSAPEALQLANAAILLAPHDLATYVGLARVQWQQHHNVSMVVTTLRKGAQNTWRELPVQKWLLGGVFGCIAAAGVLGLVFWLALQWWRHTGTLVHQIGVMMRANTDAWHGRLLAWLWFLGAVLLPLSLGAGIVTTLLVWVAYVFPYARTGHRIVAFAMIVVLFCLWVALPIVVSTLTHPSTYVDDLYLSVRDVHGDAAAQRLGQQRPDDPRTRVALAWRARWSGEWLAARNHLQPVLASGATAQLSSAALSNLWVLRGDLDWALGNGDAAIASYRKALQLQPKHVTAAYNLSRVYFVRAVQPDASTLYAQAMATDPATVEAYMRHVRDGHPWQVVDPDITKSLSTDLKQYMLSQDMLPHTAPQVFAMVTGSTEERACAATDAPCHTAWRRGMVWLWGEWPR